MIFRRKGRCGVGCIIVREIKIELVRLFVGLVEMSKISSLVSSLHFGATDRFGIAVHFFSPAQYFKFTNQYEKINEQLRKSVRLAAGREEEPSLAIIDSQSVKSTRTSGERAYDAGKKIKGIKRHILVDVLAKAAAVDMPRLKTILADDGYSGKPMAEHVREEYGWQFVSVKRRALHEFKIMPKRWVVERTFGWMNNFRGLSKHYDDDSRTGEAKIMLASIFYMTKRLTSQKNTDELESRKRRPTQK